MGRIGIKKGQSAGSRIRPRGRQMDEEGNVTFDRTGTRWIPQRGDDRPTPRMGRFQVPLTRVKDTVGGRTVVQSRKLKDIQEEQAPYLSLFNRRDPVLEQMLAENLDTAPNWPHPYNPPSEG